MAELAGSWGRPAEAPGDLQTSRPATGQCPSWGYRNFSELEAQRRGTQTLQLDPVSLTLSEDEGRRLAGFTTKIRRAPGNWRRFYPKGKWEVASPSYSEGTAYLLETAGGPLPRMLPQSITEVLCATRPSDYTSQNALEKWLPRPRPLKWKYFRIPWTSRYWILECQRGVWRNCSVWGYYCLSWESQSF